MKKLITGRQYKIKSSINPGLILKAWNDNSLSYDVNVLPSTNIMTVTNQTKYTVTFSYQGIQGQLFQVNKKVFIDNFRKCRKTSAKVSEKILEAINEQMKQIMIKPLLIFSPGTISNMNTNITFDVLASKPKTRFELIED